MQDRDIGLLGIMLLSLMVKKYVSWVEKDGRLESISRIFISCPYRHDIVRFVKYAKRRGR